MSVDNLLIITGAVLMLTFSVLLVQFAAAKLTVSEEPQVTEH